MRREERLDRQGSGKRADAEIANRTARSGQRREERRPKDSRKKVRAGRWIQAFLGGPDTVFASS
jgi:hypothetical protein